MSVILFGLGVLVLVITFADLVWTTLTLQGAGPVTRLVNLAVWRVLRFVHDRFGPCHSCLGQSGWIILVLTAFIWVTLTWAGWAMIFGSGPAAVVDGDTRAPADLPALLYFAGFTVYTLGVGDYVPNSGLWQVLTPVATINGFILLTLSVTYFLQVMSAVVGDRTAARLIHSLGGSPQSILRNAWNGHDFSALSRTLSDASQMLARHSQQHHAYPVLSYFHQRDRRASFLLQVAILGEALARIELLRGKGHGINAVALGGLWTTIDAISEVLPAPMKVVAPAPDAPPEGNMAASVWPPPSRKDTTQWVEGWSGRRKRLRTLAASDGWQWSEVEKGS